MDCSEIAEMQTERGGLWHTSDGDKASYADAFYGVEKVLKIKSAEIKNKQKINL